MRFVYLLLLLIPFVVNAQSEHGSVFCQAGKVRYFGRLANNPKARMAYPGDAAIDVTFYGLNLNITHTPNYLRGAATITLKTTAANVSSFFLDLRSANANGLGLRVDSVKTGNQRLTFRHEQNQLIITPPQPLSNGQFLTLTVYYQGNPDNNQGSFRFSQHERTTDPVIWTLSQPYGAPDWFPCKDNPGDKADSSAVSITADRRFVSVSNGTLEQTIDNPDGTRTYRWRNHYPIAQYLISLAMSNYQRYDTPFVYGSDTLPVTHYIYPEVLSRAPVRNNLDLTPRMLQLFTERLGPYPFLREKYGHAQFGQNNGGMEHQTISSMEERALTPDVIAHELAHQWFGDKITCRDWQNIWLNEGFASYAEAIYAESAQPVTGYQTTMADFLNSARRARGSLYVQDINNVGSIFDSNRSYAKGASVLHMLRKVVGDSTFFRILRTYANSPTLSYSMAVTEDFQAVAQQVSGQDLDYFFKQWIYGEGYPIYQVSMSQGTSSITVRLEQRNATATNPASFTMPVQIKVQSAAGDTIVTVLNDRPDQTFTLPSKGAVTGVLIDPDNWILKEVQPTTIVTALPEPTTSELHIYPNPTAETLTVEFATASTGPVILTLTNLLGQRVKQLTEPSLAAGKHIRTLNLRGISAGRYVLTVETPSGKQDRVVLRQ